MGNKLEMPVSMAQQTSWFWDEIARQEYIFNRRELELFVLNHTEVVNVKGFHDYIDSLWHITLEPNDPRLSCERRGGGVMSVQIEGKGKKAEKPVEQKATAAEKQDAGEPSKNAKDPKADETDAAATAAAAKKKAGTADPPKAEAKPTPSAATPEQAEKSTEGKAGKTEYRSVDYDAAAAASAQDEQQVADYLATPETAFVELSSELEHSPRVAEDRPVLANKQSLSVSKPKKGKQAAGIFGNGKPGDNKIVDQRVAVAVKTRDGEAWLLKATQSTIHSVTDQMGLYPRTALVKAPKVVDRAKESDEPLQTKLAADLNSPPNARRIKSQLKSKKAHAEQQKAAKKAKEIEKQAKKAKNLAKKIPISDKKDKKADKKKTDNKKNKANKKK